MYLCTEKKTDNDYRINVLPIDNDKFLEGFSKVKSTLVILLVSRFTILTLSWYSLCDLLSDDPDGWIGFPFKLESYLK